MGAAQTQGEASDPEAPSFSPQAPGSTGSPAAASGQAAAASPPSSPDAVKVASTSAPDASPATAIATPPPGVLRVVDDAPAGSANGVTSSTPTADAASVQDLAAQTAARSSTGASQFQLDLHPDGLGRVAVSVAIAADGQLSAAFAFDKAQTAADFGARSDELQKALQQVGFNVPNGGLSFTAAHSLTPQDLAQTGATSGGDGRAFDLGAGPAGQGAWAGGGGQQTGGGQTNAHGRAFAAAAETANAADPPPPAFAYAGRAASGVDIRI